LTQIHPASDRRGYSLPGAAAINCHSIAICDSREDVATALRLPQLFQLFSKRRLPDAVQNAGDSTADYKLDFGIRQSHKHFLKVIFHS
jgi:hypothetical protein